MDTNTRTNSNARETRNVIDEMQEKELRVVMIGKSGHGKSCFGNTLCDREAFSTSPYSASHTKRCCPASRTLDGIEIIVCDTPGLFDTNGDENTVKEEIRKAVTNIVSPGPHAFLIVIQAGRFTAEEQETIKRINDMFGEDAGKYCILIITREDDLKRHKVTLAKYIADSNKEFKSLVEQCQRRCLTVNNFADDNERTEKVRELITMVKQMLHENRSPHYTNEMFQKAEDTLRQKEKAVLDEAEAQAKARIEEFKDAAYKELRLELEKNSQKELALLENELRSFQRNQSSNDQPSDNRAIWEFASTVIDNAGMVAIRLLDYHERRSLRNQSSYDGESYRPRLPDNRDPQPTITFPPETEPLRLCSSLSSEEISRTCSSITSGKIDD